MAHPFPVTDGRSYARKMLGDKQEKIFEGCTTRHDFFGSIVFVTTKSHRSRDGRWWIGDGPGQERMFGRGPISRGTNDWGNTRKSQTGNEGPKIRNVGFWYGRGLLSTEGGVLVLQLEGESWGEGMAATSQQHRMV